jgi:hypothetical protein
MYKEANMTETIRKSCPKCNLKHSSVEQEADYGQRVTIFLIAALFTPLWKRGAGGI